MKRKTDPALLASVSALAAADLEYIKEKTKVYESVAKKGSVISIEYTNYREVTTPDMSNFRFIAETGTAGGWDVTFNSSLTFFNKVPSGSNLRRIRDFDFSLQVEHELNDLGFGKPILSFAGKYQRIANDLPDATGLARPNTKGDAAIGQLKLTIPRNANRNQVLPISLSFANRTDLIKESKIRGNFGFTFDLDRLFFGKTAISKPVEQ